MERNGSVGLTDQPCDEELGGVQALGIESRSLLSIAHCIHAPALVLIEPIRSCSRFVFILCSDTNISYLRMQ